MKAFLLGALALIVFLPLVTLFSPLLILIPLGIAAYWLGEIILQELSNYKNRKGGD